MVSISNEYISRGVPIYRIGKISAADMAKFAISEIGIDISTNIFTCTNNCLTVTILCCVDDHFTSFVAVLLLLTMVCSEFRPIICAVPRKNSLLCISDRLSISASFQ